MPLVFGLLVLIPPQTWYGGRYNSGYAGSFLHYIASGDFLQWHIRNGGDFYGGSASATSFIMVLLLLSVIALPLFTWGRKRRGAVLLAGFSRRLAHPTGWLWPPCSSWWALPCPAPAWPQVAYYLVFFVLGYVVVCDGEFMQRAERYRLPALTLGLVLATWWTLAGDRLHDSLPGGSPFAGPLFFLRCLAAWLVIVGLLGCGRRYLDRPSRLLAYLAEGSYPVYILQQTVIVVAAFYIVGLHVAEPLQWLALLIVSVAGTFALYEGVRRLPVTRFLFGMRPLKKPAAEEVKPARPAVVAAPVRSVDR